MLSCCEHICLRRRSPLQWWLTASFSGPDWVQLQEARSHNLPRCSSTRWRGGWLPLPEPGIWKRHSEPGFLCLFHLLPLLFHAKLPRISVCSAWQQQKTMFFQGSLFHTSPCFTWARCFALVCFFLFTTAAKGPRVLKCTHKGATCVRSSFLQNCLPTEMSMVTWPQDRPQILASGDNQGPKGQDIFKYMNTFAPWTIRQPTEQVNVKKRTIEITIYRWTLRREKPTEKSRISQSCWSQLYQKYGCIRTWPWKLWKHNIRTYTV